jgi:hypothetical protein
MNLAGSISTRDSLNRFTKLLHPPVESAVDLSHSCSGVQVAAPECAVGLQLDTQIRAIPQALTTNQSGA